MAIRGLFNPTYRQDACQVIPQYQQKIPALNVVKDLESPFMDVTYTKHQQSVPTTGHNGRGLDTALEYAPKRVSLRPISTNNTIQIPKDCTPFDVPSPDRDAYCTLKLNDEMSQFYHDILVQKPPHYFSLARGNTNNLYFKEKYRLELLREKQHQALNALGFGANEFNFVFRDFYGHLTMLLEQSKWYNWSIMFLLPFLDSNRDNGNASQAFVECSQLIKHICRYQQQEPQLGHSMITSVWPALELHFKHDRRNHDLAGEVVRAIVEWAPISQGEIVRKVIAMRHCNPHFFRKEMGPYRLFRTGLMKILFDRVIRDLTITNEIRVWLLRDILTEARETYHLEPNPFGKNKLCESFNINPGQHSANMSVSPPPTAPQSPPALPPRHPQVPSLPIQMPQLRTCRRRQGERDAKWSTRRAAPAAARITSARITSSRISKPRWEPDLASRSFNRPPPPQPLPEHSRRIQDRFRSKRALIVESGQNLYRSYIRDRFNFS